MLTHHDREEKAILAMLRELDILSRRHSEKVTLDEPIQRGWKRHFVLTDRARERSDRAVLETILNEIDHVRYHWRHNFKDGKRGRLSFRFRTRWIEHEHRLRGICTGRWPRLNWPDAWKYYFRIEKTVNQSGGVGTAYRFAMEELFRLKTERHFITELPLLNPTAIEREAEIEAWLDRGGRRWKGYKLRNGYSRWRCWKEIQEPREKHFESLSKRRIKAAMRGDWEADGGTQTDTVTAFRRRFPVPSRRFRLMVAEGSGPRRASPLRSLAISRVSAGSAVPWERRSLSAARRASAPRPCAALRAPRSVRRAPCAAFTRYTERDAKRVGAERDAHAGRAAERLRRSQRRSRPARQMAKLKCGPHWRSRRGVTASK